MTRGTKRELVSDHKQRSNKDGTSRFLLLRLECMQCDKTTHCWKMKDVVCSFGPTSMRQTNETQCSSSTQICVSKNNRKPLRIPRKLLAQYRSIQQRGQRHTNALQYCTRSMVDADVRNGTLGELGVTIHVTFVI